MTTESVRSISMTPVATAVAHRVFVSLGANAEVNTSGAGAQVVGVSLMASPADNQAAIPVTCLDGSKQEVVAGGAIDVSGGLVPIASNASGKAVAATTGQVIVGYALKSGALDEIIEFVSTPAAAVAP